MANIKLHCLRVIHNGYNCNSTFFHIPHFHYLLCLAISFISIYIIMIIIQCFNRCTFSQWPYIQIWCYSLNLFTDIKLKRVKWTILVGNDVARRCFCCWPWTGIRRLGWRYCEKLYVTDTGSVLHSRYFLNLFCTYISPKFNNACCAKLSSFITMLSVTLANFS